MEDEERRILLGEFEKLNDRLTGLVTRWLTIGIVTGILIWEGAKWLVAFVLRI